ncbi:MAG: glucose-6-phosphate dehydrogenase assembly protein OpcA [Chloroflexota bacterium]
MAPGVKTTSEHGDRIWRGKDVDVTMLEGHLTDLWKTLARKKDMQPVRTHIFNLVVYVGEHAHAHRILDSLNALGQLHPSRTVVLIADLNKTESTIDAEVILRADSSQSISVCHEQVLLTVHGRAADHLSSVVIPLVLPELPTYLWWPGQPLFGHRMFHRLLSSADHLVVDSAQFESPGDSLADLARLCTGPHGVTDFNWARLTPWREIITQFFDGERMLQHVRHIQSMRLEFGKGGGSQGEVTSSVLLLLGWMANQLDWVPDTTLDRPAQNGVTLSVLQRERRIPIDLVFREHGPDNACRLMNIEIRSKPPGSTPAVFRVSRSSDLQHVRTSIKVGDETEISRVLPLEVRDDVELLAAELEITGQDNLYDAVVASASRMAGRETWNPGGMGTHR